MPIYLFVKKRSRQQRIFFGQDFSTKCYVVHLAVLQIEKSVLTENFRAEVNVVFFGAIT